MNELVGASATALLHVDDERNGYDEAVLCHVQHCAIAIDFNSHR